jgi:hypothetical protein
MILDFCLIWDARSMFLDDVHDVAWCRMHVLYDVWCMLYDLHDVWCMMLYDVWCMMHVLWWCMMHDDVWWCMMHNVWWCMMHDVWCMMYDDVWCMILYDDDAWWCMMMYDACCMTRPSSWKKNVVAWWWSMMTYDRDFLWHNFVMIFRQGGTWGVRKHAKNGKKCKKWQKSQK